MVRTEATADDSLAAMRARSKFGIAIAAMIRMMATTISSSISEKPFCFRISFFPSCSFVLIFWSRDDAVVSDVCTCRARPVSYLGFHPQLGQELYFQYWQERPCCVTRAAVWPGGQCSSLKLTISVIENTLESFSCDNPRLHALRGDPRKTALGPLQART